MFNFYISIIFLLLIANCSCKFDLNNLLEEIENPYSVLQIAPWSSIGEIKKQYRKLTSINHGDKPMGSTEKFVKIRNAYDKIFELRNIINNIEETSKFDRIMDLAEKTRNDFFQITIFLIILYVIFAYVSKIYFFCFSFFYNFNNIVYPHLFSGLFFSIVISLIAVNWRIIIAKIF